MDLKLGLIYKDGVIINHRSLLKVLLNPILRFFAFQIGTPANQERTEVKGICLSKCKRTKTMKFSNSWKYDTKCDLIDKKRIFI